MYVYPSSPSAAAADAWGNEHWISDDDHVDIGEGRKEGGKEGIGGWGGGIVR